MSLAIILQCHSELGWTYRGSAYCQLIRQWNIYNGLRNTCMKRKMHFKMTVGVMKHLFRWKPTKDIGTGKREMLRKVNHGSYTLNANFMITCLKCSYKPKHPPKVHVLAAISLLKYVFLKNHGCSVLCLNPPEDTATIY